MNHLWKLHWLEASGEVRQYESVIVREAETAFHHLSCVTDVPRLDILIQCVPEAVIPETGFAGRAYSSTLFGMAIDPANPNLSRELQNGRLIRQIVHEVHHCLRMRGPGYGWTLGEALVSEGLAGQFVCWLLETAAEPWECAIERSELQANPVPLTTLQSARYDHSAWFFGTGAYRRWYGYTLGYQMVAAWHRRHRACPTENWFGVTADDVIAAALEEGLVTQ